MRRLRPLLAVALLALPVMASGPTRYLYESAANGTAQPCAAGSCTRAAPSAASEGMLLTSLKGYHLSICAASGQTLSGTGTMQAYYYNYAAALWMRAPDLDQAVTSTTRCQPFTDFVQGVAFDERVLFAASSVAVSGGAGLDVYLEGY